MKPLISIITVVFNDKDIIKTIESFIPHLDETVEAIIVDGNSTDGTRELIQEYGDRMKILSEADKGIYDAINKGVSLASGTYILHINAGDFLLNLPLAELYKERCDESVAALSFPVLMNSSKTFYPSWNWKMKFKNTLHHQGTFYRRELDFYDISYRVFADADLNKRLYKGKSVVKIYTAPCIANHLWNGVSTMTNNRKEWYKVIVNTYGYFYLLMHFGYRLVELILNKNNKM